VPNLATELFESTGQRGPLGFRMKQHDQGVTGNRGLSDIGVKAKHLDLTLSESA